MNLHYNAILQIIIIFQTKRRGFSVFLSISLKQKSKENVTYAAGECGEKIYRK